MKNVKHIVVVRFSIKKSVKNLEFDRKKWFEYRSKLFLESTYVSLMSNTIEPDDVILLMDTNDKNYFSNYFSNVKNITPIFGEANQIFIKSTNYINERYSSQKLILYRIDSDDIIASNYFESHGKSIDQNNDIQLFNVPNGYRSNLKKLQQVTYPKSPFGAIYFGKYLNQNIYEISHEKWDIDQTKYVYETSWIQLVHGNNISNAMKSNLIIFRHMFLNLFIGNRNFKNDHINILFHKSLFYLHSPNIKWDRLFEIIYLK